MAKVHISVVPCTLADGSPLEFRGRLKFVVWTYAYGDFGRNPAGRRNIGGAEAFTYTFEEAIAEAQRLATAR